MPDFVMRIRNDSEAVKTVMEMNEKKRKSIRR